MNITTRSQSRSEARLTQILEDYIAAIEGGAAFDRSALLAAHPDLAEELEACLASLDFLRAASPADRLAGDGDTTGQLGDFRILREVGRGGMGVVYEADQLSLKRRVALKVVLAGRFATADDLRRFRVEAEAAAQLDHPNIVPIYEVGEHTGLPFFSMKLLDGGSLADRISNPGIGAGGTTIGRRPSVIPPSEAAHLTAVIARAINHAHRRGILHRDLKPSNILLDAAGQPYITDFGLAKRLGETGELTRTGVILGSPPYMAPEQTSGKQADITTATDVYGLGALLYALLTGRPPICSDSLLETLVQIRLRDPDPPRRLNPAVDADLQAICLQCLEKDPLRRYASADAMADDLERWLRGEPVAARPTSAWRGAWNRFRRRPAPVLAAVVGGLALLLLTLGPWFWRRHQADQEAILSRDLALRDERRRDQADRYVLGIQSAARLIQLGDANQAHGLLPTLGNSADGPDRGFEWYRLERICRGEPVILRDHDGDVYFAAYSPDGATLATCGKDGTIRLRDAASGRTRRVIGPIGTELNGLSFSPDGAQIAACGDVGRAWVWDFASESNDPLLTLHAEDGGEAVAVLYTPDGRWLLSFSRNSSIRRWEASTGKLAATWDAGLSKFEAAAIARQGTTLIVAGWEPWPLVYDWLKGERIKRLDPGFVREVPHPGGVALSADGRLAASEGPGQAVLLWDVNTGRVITRLQGHRVGMSSLAFSADSRSLMTLGGDGELRIWNLEDGTSIGRATGHVDRAWCLIGSADGRRLVTTGREGSVRLWDLDAWAERTLLDGPSKSPRMLVFSPDNETLTVFDFFGGRATWDVATGRFVTSDDPPTPVGAMSAAASGDGRTLAFGKDDSSAIEVRNADGRGLLARVDRPILGPLCSLALSADGRTLGANESLQGGPVVSVTRVFDVGSGKEIARRQAGRDEWETVCLAFSPRGNRLAGRTYENWLWSWNLDTGELLRIPARGGRSVGLVFSPDGSLLATGGSERGISLLAADTLQPRAPMVNHTGAVCGLDFSPDGLTLASAADDRTVRLWNVATRQELLRLDGHSGPVHCIRFSPDGRTLASAAESPSGAGEVILWHTTARPKGVQPVAGPIRRPDTR